VTFKFNSAVTELNLLVETLDLAACVKKEIESCLIIGKGKSANLNIFKSYVAALVEGGGAAQWLKDVTEDSLKLAHGHSNRLYQLLIENKIPKSSKLIQTFYLEGDLQLLQIATQRADLFSSKQLHALHIRKRELAKAQAEELAAVTAAIRSRREELLRVRGDSPIAEPIRTGSALQRFVPEEDDPASYNASHNASYNAVQQHPTKTTVGAGSDVLIQCEAVEPHVSHYPHKMVESEMSIHDIKRNDAKNIFLKDLTKSNQQFTKDELCSDCNATNYIHSTSLNLMPTLSAPTYKPSNQKQDFISALSNSASAGAHPPKSEKQQDDDQGEWVTASQKKGGSSSKWSTAGSKQSSQKSISSNLKSSAPGPGEPKKGENNERWRCQNGASCYWLKKGPDVCRYYHPPEEIAAVARAKLTGPTKGEKLGAVSAATRDSASVKSTGSGSGGTRVEKTLRISPSVVGWIIGKGGKTILNLKEESGAGVWIDQESMDPEAMRIVYITGSAESVEKAITMVKDLVEAAPGISPGSIVEVEGSTEELTPMQPLQSSTTKAASTNSVDSNKVPSTIASRAVSSDSFSSVVSSAPTTNGTQAPATKKAAASTNTATTTNSTTATTTKPAVMGSGALGGVQKTPSLEDSLPLQQSSLPLSGNDIGSSHGSSLLLDSNLAPSLAPGYTTATNTAISAPSTDDFLQRPLSHVNSQPMMPHFTLSLGELSPFISTPTNAQSMNFAQGTIGSPPFSGMMHDPSYGTGVMLERNNSSFGNSSLYPHDGSQTSTPPEPVAREMSPSSTSSASDALLAFLQSYQSCFKGSAESFHQWLKDSEDIDNLSDLADAISDEDYVREVLQPGDGLVGLKGFKRISFKKAVFLAVGISIDTIGVNTGEGRFNGVIPPELMCPIRHVIMKDDPVIAADGHTYERNAIEAWYQMQQAELSVAVQELTRDPNSHRAKAILDRGVLSPVTHVKMNSLELIPNHAIRAMARDIPQL